MISKYLSYLFKILNKEQISYCVLRSYEFLPRKTDNDIDIWVKKEDSIKFKKILFESVNIYGWSIIKPNVSPRLWRRGEGKYYIVKKTSPFEVIHLDIWTYPYWRGLSYINVEYIPSHRILYKNNFYISSYEIEIALSLLGDLLHKGKISDKHKTKIKQCLNNNFNDIYFTEILKVSIGKKTTNNIINLMREYKWTDLEKVYKKLRLNLSIRSLFHNPYAQIKNWWFYFLVGLKDVYIKKYGFFLVLVGPDGTGKTTIARKILNSEFSHKLFKKKYYFHTNFSFLPRLRKIGHLFRLLKHNKSEPENSNKQLNPLPFLKSMIYPIYYGFNYFLGHFWIWKKKTNGGSLIVFDRYFHEYLIQPSFSKCPRWLLRRIHELIPKPDLLVFIKSEAEIIHSRKKELPLHEIKRQLKVCERIVKENKNGITIYNHSIDNAVNKIKRNIIENINS